MYIEKYHAHIVHEGRQKSAVSKGILDPKISNELSLMRDCYLDLLVNRMSMGAD